MAQDIQLRLQEELDRAGAAPIQVVVQIRAVDQPQNIPSADESVALAKSLLDRVAEGAGCRPTRTNVLRNLATVIVEASPAFIRLLVKQPEVISAMLNRSGESPMIPPVNKRPV